MADYAIHDTTLIGISNVIRKKEGSSALIDPADYPKRINLMGMLEEKTASSASVCSFSDGADGVPLKNWLVTLPASLDGYTEVNGTKSGKNWFFVEDSHLFPRDNNTIVDNNASFTAWAKVKKNTTYYIKKSGNTNRQNVFGAYSAPAVGVNTYLISRTEYATNSYYFNSGDYEYIGFYYSNEASEHMMMALSQEEVNIYEAYNATQYTASLGRTVYGGTADIVTGEGEDENGNSFTFTPITPTPETALGVNNFWADEGDSDVTYRSSGTVTPVPVQPTLIAKTITENGTYSAEDDNADGYDEVTVNIPSETELDFTGITTSYSVNGVDYNSNGAVFNSTSDYIALPFVKGSVEIEIDVASMSLNTDQHRRFVSSDLSNGFLYRRDGGVWSFYNGSWYNSEISDGSYFSNSTVKIVVDSNNYWHIYKDGVLVFEPQGALALKNVCIGSTSASINNATITAIRVKEVTT